MTLRTIAGLAHACGMRAEISLEELGVTESSAEQG